jgi:hypothetical protein
LAAEPYPVVAVTVSGNSAQQANAWDGDTGTAWRDVVAGRRQPAFLEFDLGAAKRIGVVRWWLSLEGVTGTLRVKVFDLDHRLIASYIASVGESTINQWQEIRPEIRGRYIRFEFTQARADGVAGGLAEAAVYPPQPAQVATPSASGGR